MRFPVDHELLEVVVRAITVAFDEVNQRRVEEDLETNNWMMLGRADYINSNLRRMALIDGVELIPFQRFAWHGRILLDRRYKATVVIMSENTLPTLTKKHRARPHYTETLQHTMNTGLPGRYEQTSLFPMDRFDEQTYADDFKSIVNEIFDPADGYKNYFITYTHEHSRVVDIKLTLFNDKFELVDEESLNEFIRPNFAALTSPVEAVGPKTEEEHVEATRGLMKLKSGIKPALRKEEQQA